MFCCLKSGLQCSNWKNVWSSAWLSNSLVLAHVRNLFRYASLKDVPTERGVDLYGPIEGKKFQIKTDAKIESGHDIRFYLDRNFVTFEASKITVRRCGPYYFETTAGFLSRGGILTFLKTQTILKIWFDDVLELDWDFSVVVDCVMRSNATKITFHLLNVMDTASKQYRFSTGKTNLLAVCYIVVLKVHFLYLIKMQLFQLKDFYRTCALGSVQIN